MGVLFGCSEMNAPSCFQQEERHRIHYLDFGIEILRLKQARKVASFSRCHSGSSSLTLYPSTATFGIPSHLSDGGNFETSVDINWGLPSIRADSCKWLPCPCTELTQSCFGLLSRNGNGTWRQCELLLKHRLVLYGDSDGFVVVQLDRLSVYIKNSPSLVQPPRDGHESHFQTQQDYRAIEAGFG